MLSETRYSAYALRAALLGLPGIIVLPFVVEVPEGVPAAALMTNPGILLALAALAGAWAAPKTRLRSAFILRSPFQLKPLPIWALCGLVAGLAVGMIDHWTAPVWNGMGIPTLREGRDAADLALGILYGGLTEEVLLRWGLLTLLALGLIRLMPRGPAFWAAACISACLFALAHLPAIMLEAGGITTGLLVRTLLWNGLLGLAYGAAFLRHGLEAAIIAHMATHIGFAIMTL